MIKFSSEPGVTFVDLSHTIEDGLITYKGLPAPIICDFMSREESREFYEPGTEFQIAKLELVGNTGTYLDCPFHRFHDGSDLSQISLTCLVDLEAVLVRVPFEQTCKVGVHYFRGLDLKGKAVLINTGWDKHWNTDRYFNGNPYLTEEAANYLVDSGVRLAGIDSLNIDDTSNNRRPVHTLLLGAGILIVEHLCNMAGLPESFTFSATPPKIKHVGTFPVRAFAKITNKQQIL